MKIGKSYRAAVESRAQEIAEAKAVLAHAPILQTSAIRRWRCLKCAKWVRGDFGCRNCGHGAPMGAAQ